MNNSSGDTCGECHRSVGLLNDIFFFFVLFPAQNVFVRSKSAGKIRVGRAARVNKILLLHGRAEL